MSHNVINCSCISPVQESTPAGGSAPGATAGWVPSDPSPSRGPAPHGLRHHGHHEESHAHEQGRLHRRLRQGVLCWPYGRATFKNSTIAFRSQCNTLLLGLLFYMK